MSTPELTATGANVRTRPGIGSVAAARPARQQPRPEPAAPQRWSRFEQSRWALVLILALQTALTLRLVWSNTAFQDEALYIWTGHMEWSHLLDGAPLPDVAGYLSGAPMLYPPLVAYADSIAGLAGARLLSLVFMLIATTLLHGVTRRLFDRRAAFLGAGLFAGLGSVQFLGALATYDAMSLMLIALATWVVVRAAHEHPVLHAHWLLLCGLLLAAANLTKYASFVFDPVVIATAGLLVWRSRGVGAGLRAGIVIGMTLLLALGAFLMFAAPGYWAGITSTTLSRAHGNNPPFVVVESAVMWIGVVMGLGLIGAVALAIKRRDLPTRLLAVVLGCAAFVAPLSQARIHVLTSLFKHLAFGAWFGSILGGFALAALVTAVPAIKVRAAKIVAVACVVLAAGPGISLATAHYTNGWPNDSQLLKVLAPLVKQAQRSHGVMLFDQHSIVEYYLTHGADTGNVWEVQSFNYKNPKTGIWTPNTTRALREAIAQRHFALIALSLGVASNVYDGVVRADIERYHDYHLVASLDGGLTSSAEHPHGFLVYVVNRR